jgi:putative membrane protein
MKTSILILSVLTVALSTACTDRDNVDAATTPAADTAAATATPNEAAPADVAPAAAAPSTAPAQDDGLALGLLASVNEHEIKAADQAISKKVTGAVLDFAKLMKAQHTENQAKTLALGAREDAPEVQEKKQKGEAELADLGKLSGKDYERAYAQAMVKGHTDALTLIDEHLLPMASQGPAKEHLTTTREHVAMHLETAKKL